jgi:5-methylcytosine-specific restriction endonuclease McrA
MHSIGQDWVSQHHQYAENGGYTQCAYCHGGNYTGTGLSKVPADRTFSVEDGGSRTFSAGHQISCYDCHNGPGG